MRTCVPETVPQFNIKMPSYQYRKSHCGDKTVVRSSYLHNGNSYTSKTTSLYWIRAQVSRARTNNYTPQYLWYAITCHCPWHLLLAHTYSHHPGWFLYQFIAYILSNQGQYLVLSANWWNPCNISPKLVSYLASMCSYRHWFEISLWFGHSV